MSGKALVRIKTVRRPNSQEILGFRIEAAIPNDAGRVMRARKEGGETVGFYATGASTPSFVRPYKICESSDHTTIGAKKVTEFVEKQLYWQGYKDIAYVGKFDGTPLIELMAMAAAEARA